jgi:hypothetical protein
MTKNYSSGLDRFLLSRSSPSLLIETSPPNGPPPSASCYAAARPSPQLQHVLPPPQALHPRCSSPTLASLSPRRLPPIRSRFAFSSPRSPPSPCCHPSLAGHPFRRSHSSLPPEPAPLCGPSSPPPVIHPLHCVGDTSEYDHSGSPACCPGITSTTGNQFILVMYALQLSG